MKKFLCLFIAFYLSHPFYGQNQKAIDSLLQLTESDISAKDKVDAYLKVAFEHVGSDSTGASFYIDKALKIADDIGYEEGKMDALYVRGRSSLLSGDYVNSEKYLEQLISGSNLLNYPKGIANAYYATAWLNYYQGNYDLSIEYHLKSLEIRNSLDNQIDISDCLRGLGITYKLKGEFDQALRYLNQSLTIESEINNKGGMATTLNHIGVINSIQGDYSTAMDIYFETLTILEQLDDKSGLAYTFQNIGVIYELQKEYERALEYYDKSLQLRKDIGETRGVAQIINNMGIVYHRMGNYEKALDNYLEAMSIKEELGDKRGVADGQLNIGRLYADQGQHQKAIAYKQKSLEISEETDSDWGRVEALISLGRTYQDIGNYLVSKRHLLQGIELAKESKLLKSIRDGVKVLAIVESQLGHYEDALEAQVLFQQMSDSLSNQEITRRITLLEAQYQFRKEKDSIQFANEKEKLLLDKQITVQRNTQFATLFIVILLIMAIIVLVRYYRLKNESNKRLSALNQEIQERNLSLRALNDEKNNLISIVAHDLQNPLSGIVGAVDLLQDRPDDEEYKKLLSLITLSSSRMMKMITDILNVEAIEKSVETMDLKGYDLSKTVVEVCDQFSKQASSKSIKIKTSIPEGIHALVDERYAVQIVENLISNAIKFSPEGKQIEIDLSADSGKATLIVTDHGPGLSDADKSKLFQRFQRLSAKPTGNESSTGLGLSIVKQLVERIGGSIRCESELGKGASFIVELKLSDRD